jgi:hypothetical protein
MREDKDAVCRHRVVIDLVRRECEFDVAGAVEDRDALSCL